MRLGETIRATLNEIATVAPQWLKQIMGHDWVERYSWRFDNYRLPKKKNERELLAKQIGLDGHKLLEQLWLVNEQNLADLRHLLRVRFLKLCVDLIYDGRGISD